MKIETEFRVQLTINESLTDVGSCVILIDQVTNVLPAIYALSRSPPLQSPVAGEHTSISDDPAV